MHYTITNQELFDRVLAHSRKMTQQSTDGETCLYRSSGGTNCCFVGALITDEVYADYNNTDEDGGIGWNSLEGKNATDREVRDSVERSLGKKISYAQAQMLASLQTVHDGVFEQREEGLENVARVYGLEYKKEEK